jgi:hypothetical protein
MTSREGMQRGTCMLFYLLVALFSLHFISQCLPTNKGSLFARKLVLRLASHWQFIKLNKVINK